MKAGIRRKKQDILFEDAAKRFLEWCEAGNLWPKTRNTPHDLRHTWASRLGEGVDDRTLQELGGWKTLEIVKQYSHTNERRKAQAVKLLEGFHGTEFPAAIHDTKVAPLAAIR